MRNAYVPYLNPGNWLFVLDGDEVYTERQLFKVSELMKKYDVLFIQFWLFWNNMDTLGVGKWEHFPQERVVRWKDGFGYRNGNHLHVSNIHGKLAKDIVPCYQGQDKLFFHYSWIRPIEKIRQKLEYYKHQSGRGNESYVEDVFLRWRENPELVRGKTHPFGGGDFKKFEGEHPSIIQKLIKERKFNF
jgi:hypothetical protein